MRCSCRAAICGSCGVKINGQSTLACLTQIGEAHEFANRANDDGEPDRPIVVEPMGNMPVIKDLVTDMESTHWEKIRRVTPWLLDDGDPPERERIVPPESMVDITQTIACIQCGACVCSCLSMEVDPDFIGPAALAKAYRFVGDPRDVETRERLYDLAQDPHGIYDCTHCFSCVDACPKGVAPMDQIMRLRRAAGNDEEIRRPQQRPQPRGRVREDHREEGHPRRVAAAAGVLRAGGQGQADPEAGGAQGAVRLDPDRDPRHAQRQDALAAEADPRASTRSSPATRRTRSSASTSTPRSTGSELNLYITGEEDVEPEPDEEELSPPEVSSGPKENE